MHNSLTPEVSETKQTANQGHTVNDDWTGLDWIELVKQGLVNKDL